MVIHAQSVVAEGGSSSAICLYATTQTALYIGVGLHDDAALQLMPALHILRLDI